MITAVLIARNEEARIQKWIDQLSWCDERLVIDNASTDQTANIATRSGAHVVRVDTHDFSHLRNSALDLAKNDWLLYVDADEILPPKLIEEIKQAITRDRLSAYYLRREDIFWGTALHYGEVRSAYQKGIIRLVKKNAGRWHGAVHETFQLKKHTTATTLPTPIQHHAHEGVKDFLYAINDYSTLRADELRAQKKRAHLTDITIRPFAKFIYTYFLLQGFRDGPAGFAYAFMMSFHAFLVRGKMYLKQAR